MEKATYYKCKQCGYEFLAKQKNPACPKCKTQELETKDLATLAGLND